MEKPVITKAVGGEFSTVLLPSGVVETIWFGNDGSQVIIGRTYPFSIRDEAAKHIREFRGEK